MERIPSSTDGQLRDALDVANTSQARWTTLSPSPEEPVSKGKEKEQSGPRDWMWRNFFGNPEQGDNHDAEVEMLDEEFQDYVGSDLDIEAVQVSQSGSAITTPLLTQSTLPVDIEGDIHTSYRFYPTNVESGLFNTRPIDIEEDFIAGPSRITLDELRNKRRMPFWY